MQHRVVEPFEILGAQPAEPLAALGLAYVVAVGADSYLESLAGQPVPAEVVGEGERSDLVVTVVAFSGESRDKGLGLGMVGADRVPGLAFLAGDGIESFVDGR
ncbi:MAG TPA: hypothetical protein VL068_13645, partial [Microthrixaceae bacterium]|nr:hypothetical protein [Microthrixaceae bacterium]